MDNKAEFDGSSSFVALCNLRQVVALCYFKFNIMNDKNNALSQVLCLLGPLFAVGIKKRCFFISHCQNMPTTNRLCGTPKDTIKINPKRWEEEKATLKGDNEKADWFTSINLQGYHKIIELFPQTEHTRHNWNWWKEAKNKKFLPKCLMHLLMTANEAHQSALVKENVSVF